MQEDGISSQRLAWRLQMRHLGPCGTCATAVLLDEGCQHPEDQAFLAGVKEDSIARSDCAVQDVKSRKVEAW